MSFEINERVNIIRAYDLVYPNTAKEYLASKNIMPYFYDNMSNDSNLSGCNGVVLYKENIFGDNFYLVKIGEKGNCVFGTESIFRGCKV